MNRTLTTSQPKGNTDRNHTYDLLQKSVIQLDLVFNRTIGKLTCHYPSQLHCLNDSILSLAYTMLSCDIQHIKLVQN
jgi:hypothetical protein